VCIICDHYNEGRLTIGEAISNYNEMKESLSEEHQKEMEEKLFNNFSSYPIASDYLSIDEDEFWERFGFGD